MRLRGFIVPIYFLAAICVAAILVTHVGREVFPITDQGQVKVRIRAPSGTKLEATEEAVLKILGIVREAVGEDKIHKTLAFVGQQPPEYPINDVYKSGHPEPEEAVLRIALKQGLGVEIENFKGDLSEKR